ncbi:MAG: hypothetical protein ACFFDM_09410 [Candidatus Thorarchaeota archaeon]
MRPTRSELISKILLALDNQPSSIYDILYSISDFSDPRRTRLPKLLKAMEKDNLVVSALQPGPLGPYRRVYEIGPEAEARMRQNLKNSIETILHFYDSYRRSNPQKLYSFPKELEQRKTKGRILFAAFPRINAEDIDSIRKIISCSHEITISVLGPDLILSKTGIKYTSVGNNPTEIKTENQIFSEIQFNGIPSKETLPLVIAECKRVLVRRGLLKIRVPLAFFEEPKKPALGEFILITAANLFPELGVIDGNELKQSLAEIFPKNGIYETSLGEVVFWAIKS